MCAGERAVFLFVTLAPNNVEGKRRMTFAQTAETVARNTGATVVDVTQFPGGVKGTEGGYIPMMDYLVKSVAGALAQK